VDTTTNYANVAYDSWSYRTASATLTMESNRNVVICIFCITDRLKSDELIGHSSRFSFAHYHVVMQHNSDHFILQVKVAALNR